jgi:AraC-like DNA-binding protein
VRLLAINIEIVPRIRLVGFISYKSPWLHFKRMTDEYVLYFIKSGELHMKENGHSFVLRKGDIYVLEPNMEHEGTEHDLCDYYYIHFEHGDIRTLQVEDMKALAQYFIAHHDQSPFLEGKPVHPLVSEYDCCFPKSHAITDKARFRKALLAMNDMLQLYRRKHYNHSLTALRFTELLIELSRDNFMDELQRNDRYPAKSIGKVNGLLDYIHQNYPHKITSHQIESVFDGNYDYLNRCFKAMTGQTITQYVNQVRIKHAKELIETTDLTFGEIGYLTGLNDPYYFSKVFKKHVGMPPNQYAKRMIEEKKT